MQLQPAFSLKPPSTYLVRSADLSSLQFSTLTPVHFPTSLLPPVLYRLTFPFIFFPHQVNQLSFPYLFIFFLTGLLCHSSHLFLIFFPSFFQYFSFSHPSSCCPLLSLFPYQKMAKPLPIASFSPDLSQQTKIKH